MSRRINDRFIYVWAKMNFVSADGNQITHLYKLYKVWFQNKREMRKECRWFLWYQLLHDWCQGSFRFRLWYRCFSQDFQSFDQNPWPNEIMESPDLNSCVVFWILKSISPLTVAMGMLSSPIEVLLGPLTHFVIVDFHNLIF